MFTYHELTEGAQQKVLEKLYDVNVGFGDWWDFVYEEWIEKLDKMGFYNVKIYFSGFSSQGDGASFEANVDIEKWLTVNKKKSQFPHVWKIEKENGIACSITKSGHYEHEYTMGIDTSDSYYMDEKTGSEMDELEKLILEDARGQARAIYKDLEQEYTWLTSKEAIVDTIEANDWIFLEDGTLFSE